MSLEQELIESHMTGRWSFAVAVPQPGAGIQAFRSGNLLYATLPAWAARCWTVSLCGMRYTSGNLATSQPPDNQVDTLPRYFADITWGVDGALETARCDYPWGGCTIMIQAATVQVQVGSTNAPGVLAAPLLSGFLCPSPSSQTAVANPTFTPPIVSAAPGGNAVYQVPKRGCAFRVLDASGAAIAIDTIQIAQLDAFGNQVWYSATYPTSANYPGGQDNTQQNVGMYYPLDPRAEQVRFNNNSTGSVFLGLQFLLDMG